MTGLRQPGAAKENLVFSSGYGYPPTYLRAFLKSISRNMKTADVILFYHDTSEHYLSQLREYLSTVRVVKPKGHLVRRAIGLLPRGRGLTSHLVHYLAPSLVGATSRIQCARYFWVKSYCDLVDITQYKRIMLCDSRDVVVQSDAFDMVDGIGFITGTEERRIGECPSNRSWIYSHYGRHILKELWDEWIVCSGVSLGPREMVLEYVHAMTQEFNRSIDSENKRTGGDQVVHNYLIRTKELNFPVHVSKSSDGIIGTLGYYDPKRIVLDEFGSTSLENGVTPCIIHQYDRVPELRQHYSKF
jgi:hypothetical protein